VSPCRLNGLDLISFPCSLSDIVHQLRTEKREAVKCIYRGFAIACARVFIALRDYFAIPRDTFIARLLQYPHMRNRIYYLDARRIVGKKSSLFPRIHMIIDIVLSISCSTQRDVSQHSRSAVSSVSMERFDQPNPNALGDLHPPRPAFRRNGERRQTFTRGGFL